MDDSSTTAMAAGSALSRCPETGVAGIILDMEPPLTVLATKAELQLADQLHELEIRYRQICQVQFQASGDEVEILSVSPVNRSGQAAIRFAVDLVSKGVDTRHALGTVSTADMTQATFGRSVPSNLKLPSISGCGVSEGVAAGRLCFSAESVSEAVEKDQQPVLVMVTTSPADSPVMELAEAIVTLEGGVASHAAIVARSMGIPAVSGLEDAEIVDGQLRVGSDFYSEGTDATVDGTSGQVLFGLAEIAPVEVAKEIALFSTWAEEVCHRLCDVRVTADNAAEVAMAGKAGTEVVGLCRTEHQFVGAHADLISRLIYPQSRSVSREDIQLFESETAGRVFPVLAAVCGISSGDKATVGVRLLDGLSHEFSADVSAEVNPMLGLRGVRLGIAEPEIYRAQIRGVLQAAQRLGNNNVSTVCLEFIIPFVADPSDVVTVKEWITNEIETAGVPLWQNQLRLETLVGAMIETPRAAKLAGELAAVADFITFGTNDLTQLVLGVSRDDSCNSQLRSYVSTALGGDPFKTLDQAGVYPLMVEAVDAALRTNPDIQIGVCGDQCADSTSLELLVELGIDYISCPPPLLPIAKLGTAQALLRM